MSTPYHIRRAAVSIAAVMIAGGLGACSVYQQDVDGSYSAASLTAAGGTSGIPIQVDGKVGGVEGDKLAAAVAGAMPGTVGDTAVRYAPCAAYTECPGDHIVWTFGPPAARPATAYPPAVAVNLNWIGPYAPSANNVTVKVAVIQNGRVVSSAAGQVDADSPSDPDFQALIASMSDAVMPTPGWLESYAPF